MVVLKEEAKRAGLRALKNPLYDTEDMPTAGGAQTLMKFFQRPQGQALPIAGTNKTIAETNLKQSAIIGEPNEFDVFGFNFNFHWDLNYKDVGTANETLANFVADMTLVYEQAAFVFLFNNRQWLTIPLTRIPHGCFELTGPADTAVDDETYFFISNGDSSKREYCKFMVDDAPSRIHSTETFGCELRWPNAAVGLSAGGDESRCTTFIVGVYYMAL